MLGYADLFRHGHGWGRVAPSRLALGHEAARYYLIHPRLGVITDLSWRRWGKPTASATGYQAARRPGGGWRSKPVPVQLRASGLDRCFRQGQMDPTYTTLQLRRVPPLSASAPGRWRDWPLHILPKVGNLCHEPYQPRPYIRPKPNRLHVYFRGDDWNWRSDQPCTGPGLHEDFSAADYGLQGSVQYSANVNGTARLTLRNYPQPIPRGQSRSLVILVADPRGDISRSTISLVRNGAARTTYPGDFYQGRYWDQFVLRPLPKGTYTMLMEDAAGRQVGCSGWFYR